MEKKWEAHPPPLILDGKIVLLKTREDTWKYKTLWMEDKKQIHCASLD